MFRGIFHRKRLNDGVAVKKRTHLRGDFREHAVVIIFYIGTILPESGTGELSGVGIKRFDVFNESVLRLDLWQQRIVQQRTKFTDLRWVNRASDDTSDHEMPPMTICV